MRHAFIAATGSYHPERLIPNAEFDAQFGAGVGDWLVENLEIHQRYWAAPDQSTSDLCLIAARRCLRDAGVDPEDLDLIILATDTPDYLSPSTASIVQHKLGAKGAGTFDVNAACSAFVIGLDMGSKYIAADPQYRNVLVLGGYAMSRHLNPNDKKTVTLFADGAGAVLLQPTDDPKRGFLGANLHTEGVYHDWMGIFAGGTRRPVDADALDEHAHQLVFAKRFPKVVNPTTWTRMLRELCAKTGVSPQDIDHYVFTQLNINAIRETLDNLEVPRDRGHTVMQRFGYTGSACIPMAFDDLVRNRSIAPGAPIAFVASGGGLSFATALFRW